MLLQIFLPFIFLVTGLQPDAGNKSKDVVIKWVVQKSSTLDIKGKSNVNSFNCNISMSGGTDTIECTSRSDKHVTLSGEINMDVLNFNCHSTLITKDLRKTIKAKEYPRMNIRFLTLRSMPLLTNKKEPVKGWVEVQLAGVVKTMEISYTFNKRVSGEIELNGSRIFCFSDFNLSPPKKLGGMIKIKDEFDVKFQLVLEELL